MNFRKIFRRSLALPHSRKGGKKSFDPTSITRSRVSFAAGPASARKRPSTKYAGCPEFFRSRSERKTLPTCLFNPLPEPVDGLPQRGSGFGALFQQVFAGGQAHVQQILLSHSA